MLPERDQNYLEMKCLNFEVVPNPSNGAEHFLIIKDFNMGQHYNPPTVELLIVIPAGYPTSPLDMFWVHPFVTKQDGSLPAQATEKMTVEGKVWQRFSRHREVPWRPYVDGVAVHMNFIRCDLNMGR